MTAKENERIKALEIIVMDMKKQLDDNTADTKAIRSTLDNLTGGKHALMWLTSLIITALLTVAAWLGLRK